MGPTPTPVALSGESIHSPVGPLSFFLLQKWKAYVSDLLAFPPPLIEQAQEIIKDTIEFVVSTQLSTGMRIIHHRQEKGPFGVLSISSG
jgi:hypothetical protein